MKIAKIFGLVTLMTLFGNAGYFILSTIFILYVVPFSIKEFDIHLFCV